MFYMHFTWLDKLKKKRKEKKKICLFSKTGFNGLLLKIYFIFGLPFSLKQQLE